LIAPFIGQSEEIPNKLSSRKRLKKNPDIPGRRKTSVGILPFFQSTAEAKNNVATEMLKIFTVTGSRNNPGDTIPTL
jgi:hypothetical protein